MKEISLTKNKGIHIIKPLSQNRVFRPMNAMINGKTASGVFDRYLSRNFGMWRAISLCFFTEEGRHKKPQAPNLFTLNSRFLLQFYISTQKSRDDAAKSLMPYAKKSKTGDVLALPYTKQFGAKLLRGTHPSRQPFIQRQNASDGFTLLKDGVAENKAIVDQKPPLTAEIRDRYLQLFLTELLKGEQQNTENQKTIVERYSGGLQVLSNNFILQSHDLKSTEHETSRNAFVSQTINSTPSHHSETATFHSENLADNKAHYHLDMIFKRNQYEKTYEKFATQEKTPRFSRPFVTARDSQMRASTFLPTAKFHLTQNVIAATQSPDEVNIPPAAHISNKSAIIFQNVQQEPKRFFKNADHTERLNVLQTVNETVVTRPLVFDSNQVGRTEKSDKLFLPLTNSDHLFGNTEYHFGTIIRPQTSIFNNNMLTKSALSRHADKKYVSQQGQTASKIFPRVYNFAENKNLLSNEQTISNSIAYSNQTGRTEKSEKLFQPLISSNRLSGNFEYNFGTIIRPQTSILNNTTLQKSVLSRISGKKYYSQQGQIISPTLQQVYDLEENKNLSSNEQTQQYFSAYGNQAGRTEKSDKLFQPLTNSDHLSGNFEYNFGTIIRPQTSILNNTTLQKSVLSRISGKKYYSQQGQIISPTLQQVYDLEENKNLSSNEQTQQYFSAYGNQAGRAEKSNKLFQPLTNSDHLSGNTEYHFGTIIRPQTSLFNNNRLSKSVLAILEGKKYYLQQGQTASKIFTHVYNFAENKNLLSNEQTQQYSVADGNKAGQTEKNGDLFMPLISSDHLTGNTVYHFGTIIRPQTSLFNNNRLSKSVLLRLADKKNYSRQGQTDFTALPQVYNFADNKNLYGNFEYRFGTIIRPQTSLFNNTSLTKSVLTRHAVKKYDSQQGKTVFQIFPQVYNFSENKNFLNDEQTISNSIAYGNQSGRTEKSDTLYQPLISADRLSGNIEYHLGTIIRPQTSVFNNNRLTKSVLARLVDEKYDSRHGKVDFHTLPNVYNFAENKNFLGNEQTQQYFTAYNNQAGRTEKSNVLFPSITSSFRLFGNIEYHFGTIMRPQTNSFNNTSLTKPVFLRLAGKSLTNVQHYRKTDVLNQSAAKMLDRTPHDSGQVQIKQSAESPSVFPRFVSSVLSAGEQNENGKLSSYFNRLMFLQKEIQQVQNNVFRNLQHNSSHHKETNVSQVAFIKSMSQQNTILKNSAVKQIGMQPNKTESNSTSSLIFMPDSHYGNRDKQTTVQYNGNSQQFQLKFTDYNFRFPASGGKIKISCFAISTGIAGEMIKSLLPLNLHKAASEKFTAYVNHMNVLYNKMFNFIESKFIYDKLPSETSNSRPNFLNDLRWKSDRPRPSERQSLSKYDAVQNTTEKPQNNINYEILRTREKSSSRHSYILESKNLPITTGFPELINHLTFGNRITNKYKGYKLEADSENNKDGGSGILFIPELKAITKSLSAQKPTVVLRDSGNLVLTGKANVREIRTPSEIVILSPPKTAQGYENSAMKNPPPLNFKSTPESANRESSAKSPSSISQAASTKTGVAVEKKVINSADDLKPEELSRLAEKVYAQLENMLAKEKRRFGL